MKFLTGFESFVGVNFWTCLFTLCNLVILYFFMRKLLFRPVKNMIDSRQKEIEFFTLRLDDLIAVAAEGTQPMRDAEALTLRGERRRVCYDVSAQDPDRACAFLYAKGSGADSGRFVRVCFLPYPDFVGALRALCPGKVMMTDGEI